MDGILGDLLVGFSVAFSPGVLLYAFLGCLVGTLVGMLPGIGPLAGISILLPATYALDGIREAILEGQGLSAMWDEILPLLLIGAVSVPLGLWVFARGEQYAKKHGKLKRSG